MAKAVYIHIPFCNQICSYCDFCKMYYEKEWVDNYLEALNNEVISNYNGELIETIYIGGGTPSVLSVEQLNKLFKIIEKIELSETYEFTFECNISDLTEEKLKLLFDNKINRLSIGIQTFNKKHLLFLNREYDKKIMEKIKLAKKIGFNNISVDLMYALFKQTNRQLRSDIKKILKLDINHISTYSLMIEPNTKIFINNIKPISEEKDYKMFKIINKTLKKNGFIQYEISNYSKKGYESRHNLMYWDNLEYYGFGLGASGYINNIRYENTRNFNKYLKHNYRLEEHIVTKKEKLENEFILGFRKIKGINKMDFKTKYYDIDTNGQVKKLVSEKKLIDDGENIFINPKYIYICNSILINFIDT